MTTEFQPSLETPVSTGRRYASVDDLLRGEGASEKTSERVAKLAEETRVTRMLAALRAAHGLTQKEMGEKIGRTQGAISKLESGRDEDLTLSEICAYAKVLNERIGVVYGRQLNHVEAINAYAKAMKFHMLELVKLANNDSEMDGHVQKFFGDAFFSIMDLLGTVYQKLPNGIEGCQFTKEVMVENKAVAVSFGTPPAPSRELAVAST